MPVWLENEAPSTTSRSASFMSQLATGVPLRPSTPAASGWSSAMTPLALNVVMTGACRRSASAVTAAMSSRAPWPTMNTGRRAVRMSSSASSTCRCGGAMSSAVSRPAGPPAGSSGAGTVCTSSGKTRCATSRLRIACLQARFMSSACLELGSTV